MSDIDNIRFKVKAENKANTILNEVAPSVLSVFAGLEGVTILKSGYNVSYAQLFKKYQDKIEEVLKSFKDKFNEEDLSVRLWVKCSEYSLILEVSLCYNVNRKSYMGSVYHNKSRYLLNLRDGKIEKINAYEPTQEINAEEEIKTYEECLKLKEQFEKAQDKFKLYSIREMLR